MHPLTCGVLSEHRVLKPIEKEGKVVLVCEDCGYEQEFIPDCIFNIDIEEQNKKMDKLLNKMKKGKENEKD